MADTAAAAAVSGTRLGDLATPAFVVSEQAFRLNCSSVLETASANGVTRLRPHVKTHKTREGTVIQAGPGGGGDGRRAKVVGFVVSTLPELAMVVDLACESATPEPYCDILLGVPVCASRLSRIEAQRRRLTEVAPGGQVHLLIDNPGQATSVEDFVRENNADAYSVFLKLDTGYHRAGVTVDDEGVALAVLIIESNHLRLKGVYSHCGHAYGISDKDEMRRTADEDLDTALNFLEMLGASLRSRGSDFDVSSLDVSVGSTASLSSHRIAGRTTMPDADRFELHAGNYVFFDR